MLFFYLSIFYYTFNSTTKLNYFSQTWSFFILLVITINNKGMEKLKNIHPGEILLEEFLIPMEISAYRLAKETFLPQTRISDIMKGNRRITADTALRFSKFFGTSAKFWLDLQDDYNLEEEKNRKESELDSIKPIDGRAA